jgi:hypothetical protein
MVEAATGSVEVILLAVSVLTVSLLVFSSLPLQDTRLKRRSRAKSGTYNFRNIIIIV